ncbi:MAG: YicC family protein [Ruminococcaceae bacterium]|nr:YicC family protein [Oscillospiraceae bacterium]MBR3597178.1 YicC family protein [Clostridia bacterium]
MVKSMTGYGRAVSTIGKLTITVEIKSVNHRYFEFTPKVYRAYSFLEEKLKSYLQQYISRGKVDCFVQIESDDVEDSIVQVNHSLAAGYVNAFKDIAEEYELEMNDAFKLLVTRADIFTVRKAPADEDAVWEAVKTVVADACEAFINMRTVEGSKLRDDILSRADNIISNVEYIEKRSPETVKEYNDKLKNRIAELIADVNVDEQRLLTEAAIFADKIAVAEETVRLRSHIDQLRDFFESEEPVGRKLDFLVQEINREANTIGSKASDIEIARRVIDIKAEVEKIREQVQNIE